MTNMAIAPPVLHNPPAVVSAQHTYILLRLLIVSNQLASNLIIGH